MRIALSVLFIGLFALATSASALTVTTTDDATTLVNAFDGGGAAITINGAVYTGASTASGIYGDGPMGLDDGMLLTSGGAQLALPPNNGGSTTQANNLAGDPLCDPLTYPHTSYDATKLVIDFDLDAAFNGISFQFVFGSEEYPEWVNSSYNDVVGVYLDGTQIAFDEDGNPITINGPFFNGVNVVTPPANGTEYDGSTGILTTRATAAPGAHQLVVVVCDAGDWSYDSGAFLTGFNGCVGADCSGTVPCESIDDDNDGSNSCDDCDDADPNTYPGANEICDGLDNDCDGDVDEGNVCCDDTDGDGVCDDDDNCPFVANADQADVDYDGVGDVCDNCADDANADQADADYDGVGDACDNCVDDANADQADADYDGLGDVCDDCPYDADNDADADGICGDVDLCADTMIPEATVPQRILNVNRWALIDGDGVFDTRPPNGNGNGPQLYFDIEDTAGCSCEQIIDELGLGNGHVKFGCSISAMEDWTYYVSML